MECYFYATMQKGSPEWRRAKLKQWERVGALRDPIARQAFEAKYQHPPETVTVDELEGPHPN